MTSRFTMRAGAIAGATITLLATTAGLAHDHVGVDLHGATPTAGSGSTIFLRPGHGCDGNATNAITVVIPDGVTRAKAQQKAGWKVTASGNTITWSGGSLPDDQFDDFGIKLTWPTLAAGETSRTFYFPTVQTCNAELRITRSGKDARVTGWLPAYRGQSVDLMVDGIPLTKRSVAIDGSGRFTVRTTASKVPADAEVTAEIEGRVVGNSVRGVDAWLDIPIAGSTASLAMPAPFVTVVAPAAKK